MEKASIDRLYEDVDYLTSIRPYRNYRNPASLKKAVQFMKEELEDEGYTTREQKWEEKECGGDEGSASGE